ncbi:MAG: beta-propeller domain-containing protein, partial [Actinobacteria bacterium]|nr:beta-propeller domain-containing protein [Actinomycetota bacterium]
MRRNISLMLAVGLLAAACAGSPTADPTTTSIGSTATTSGGVTGVAGTFDPSQVRFVAALERFDSCEALLDHFKAEAKERVGPYGLDGNRGWWGIPEPFMGVDDMESAATTTAAAQTVPAGEGYAGAGLGGVEGVDYSGTNVQVAGVDEPDIVKTDGTRIITVVDGKISYVDVTTDEPLVLGTLQLTDGWNHTLFVVGETAFVFANGGGGIAMPTDVVATDAMIWPGFGYNSAIVLEVDISDPANMKETRTLTVEGQYLSARLIDGTVRMVISSYPNDLPFVYPSNPASEDIALEANRKVIDQTTLDDWLPDYTLVESDGSSSEGILVDCARTHRPVEFAGFETLSVLTFTADGGVDAGDATGVIAGGETVYASPESIYVATNVWIPSDWIGIDDSREFDEAYSTAIHKFSISGSDPAEYEASGSVKGHLLNQFSMDEYDGYFRVATTDGTPWGSDETSESFVVVLEQRGDQLVEAGSVGDMGKGEQIYSVRFIGDAAYVVTFRQTDPLYVVDISNPDHPVVAGELKIPGYSAYLHPLGDGRLLGIGQDATEEGRTLGAKVSLFDVSDPSDPREIDNFVLPDSYTDAEWDHHAFLYWAPEQMMVMPLQAWQDDFAGAVVFKLDDGIREMGRISHEKENAQIVESECDQYSSDNGYEDVIVQVCGPNDASDVDGYYCEVLAVEDAEWITEDYLNGEVDLAEVAGPDDHIEICWSDYQDWNPIQRSLVIGGDLWTLSYRSLQSNSLDDLSFQH